jgi:hypothetical protein
MIRIVELFLLVWVAMFCAALLFFALAKLLGLLPGIQFFGHRHGKGLHSPIKQSTAVFKHLHQIQFVGSGISFGATANVTLSNAHLGSSASQSQPLPLDRYSSESGTIVLHAT